ncbi:MAG: D-glycerate dehydrogenase [Opitutaceae bacterium]|nr:D-glycerate dehydrogenase [Opitutaceae bacterium]
MSVPLLPTVLITNTVPPDVLAPLVGVARIIQGPADGNVMARSEVLRLAPSLAGIVNQGELRVDAELLDAAPELRVVANVAMGVDNLDLPLMRARGVVATNVPSAFIESTADCTLGLILAVTRRLVEADRYVRAGGWTAFQPGVWDGMLLRGKTLGLVGYGRIGRAVEQRARAFGLEVVHHSRTPSSAPGYRPLPALLGESAIVSLHVPLNADSRGLIDATRLRQMPRGAILINMARGRVVREAELVAALQEGHLAGAGLDVFEDEPSVHPVLAGLPQVVLTPHLGGGTRESRREARLLSVHNVAAVLTGRPPSTPL